MSQYKYHIASCSFGKDSLATIILAKEHGDPLDAVVYAKVMYDENTSAEHPEHEDFINNVAIPKIESWGIPVYITKSDKTYKDCFFHIRKSGAHIGQIVGFPIPWMCDVNSKCKLPAIKKISKIYSDKETIYYIGIAKDEPKRLARLKENQISLLDKYDYTEAMCVDLCKEYGLYSPMYDFTRRGGCFFCPNASDSALRHLREYHPMIWQDMLALSATENKVRDRFNRKETLEEIERRFTSEVEVS